MSHRDQKAALADATGASLMLIAAKLENMDQRYERQFAKVEADVGELKADVGELRAMLVKLVEGQAVLLQNDMELKRRLDQPS